MRGGGEGVTNGTGLLLCQTADSRTEESLAGPVRGGTGGFASLHSLDILRPLFGLFRPYSESLGSAGFWATQYHTTRIRLACACMCMQISFKCMLAFQLWSLGRGHSVLGKEPPTIVQVRITMQLFSAHDGYYLQFSWNTR